MGCICCKEESPYTELLCQTLMYFVGAEICETVLGWLRMAGKYCLELCWLSFTILLWRQADDFAVGYPP
jgi:hypothetical protein